MEVSFALDVVIESVKVCDLNLIGKKLSLKVLDLPIIECPPLKSRVRGRPTINYNKGTHIEVSTNLDRLPVQYSKIPILFMIGNEPTVYFNGINILDLVIKSGITKKESPVTTTLIQLRSKSNKNGAEIFTVNL